MIIHIQSHRNSLHFYLNLPAFGYIYPAKSMNFALKDSYVYLLDALI